MICLQLALIMAWRKSGPLFFLLVLCLYGVAAGLSVAKLRTLTTPHTMVISELGPVMIEGWVSGIEPSTKGVRLRISVHAVEGLSRTQAPKHIRVTHTSSLKVYPGRFVRCWAVLRPPPSQSVPGDYNFRRQAWFSGLDAVGYVQGRCRGGVLGAPKDAGLRRKLDLAVTRRGLAEHVMRSSGERAGGFATALVSGDRSYIASEDQDALRGAGLAHLLAISGLHMAICGGLIYALLFRALARIEWLALRVPLQKPAAIAGLIASLIYLVISGASVSTQRAFIMAGLVFAAMLIDRQAISLRTLAIAMIVIVCLQPESVLSPGFQMSFAATGCLIATYEAWQKRRQDLPQGWLSQPIFVLKSLVVTSVVAAAATAPFALYHFDRIAPYGLLANVLAMPVITFISAPAAAVSLVLAPFGLSDLGLRLFGLSLELVLKIAHFCNGLAGDEPASWKQMPGLSLILFSLVIGSVGVLVGKTRRRGIVGLSGLAALIWIASPLPDAYWAPSGDVFVRGIGGQYQQLTFVDGDGLSPLRFQKAPSLPPCTAPRCLVETHSGPILLVNSNGLSRLCEDKPADLLALVSERPDSATCANILEYSEVTAKGGLAISLKRSGVKREHSSKCGARPWQVKCGVAPNRSGVPER